MSASLRTWLYAASVQGAEGFTSKEIGEQLFISVKTVENHRANIMSKLDIHDTAGLVRYAIKIGLIE